MYMINNYYMYSSIHYIVKRKNKNNKNNKSIKMYTTNKQIWYKYNVNTKPKHTFVEFKLVKIATTNYI